MSVEDGGKVDVVEKVLAWVNEGWVRGIAADSLELSESSGKISYTAAHSFSITFSIRFSLWSAWKEKRSGGGEAVSWPRFWNACGRVTEAEFSVCDSVMVCKLFYQPNDQGSFSGRDYVNLFNSDIVNFLLKANGGRDRKPNFVRSIIFLGVLELSVNW